MRCHPEFSLSAIPRDMFKVDPCVASYGYGSYHFGDNRHPVTLRELREQVRLAKIRNRGRKMCIVDDPMF